MVHSAFLHVLLSRAASVAAMAVSMALLGRLLGPAAFGHFALAMAILQLVQGLSDFGLQHFLVRAREITAEMAGQAIGLSLTIAGGLAVLVVGVALVGPQVMLPAPTATVLLLAAPTLLIRPFAIVTQALLQREIDFRLISVMEVTRTVANGGAAVAIAWLGAATAALGAGYLVGEIAAAALLLARGGAMSRLRPRRGGWAGFGGFGVRVVSTDLLPKTVSLALMGLMSGFLGAATLGLYDRAVTLRDLLDRTLFQGLKPVVLPVITHKLEEGHAPADIHRAKFDYLAAICWPGFALIALLAEPMILVMLGEDWLAAVPAVRILALLGLTMPVVKMSMKFFIAVDRMDEYLRIQLIQQIGRLLLAGAAAAISLEAFCAALVAASVLKAGLLLDRVHRSFGPGRPVFGALALRNLVVTLATLAGPAALLLTPSGPQAALPRLALAMPLGAAGWAAGLLVTRHDLLDHMRVALETVRPPRRRQRI